MLKPTDLRPGNIILFDHNDRRRPSVPLIRGIVEEVRKDKVVLKGDIVLGYDRISGLPIHEDILTAFGFALDDEMNKREKELTYWCIGDKAKSTFFRMCWHDVGRWTFSYRGTPILKPDFIHGLQNVYYDLTHGLELKITVPEPPPIHPQQ